MKSNENKIPHETEEQVKILHEKLHYHNHRYYVLDDPEIPDSEYDKLLRELQVLKKDIQKFYHQDLQLNVLAQNHWMSLAK